VCEVIGKYNEIVSPTGAKNSPPGFLHG